jgi:hypothetical protein
LRLDRSSPAAFGRRIRCCAEVGGVAVLVRIRSGEGQLTGCHSRLHSPVVEIASAAIAVHLADLTAVTSR